jgi:hypothetical protein
MPRATSTPAAATVNGRLTESRGPQALPSFLSGQVQHLLATRSFGCSPMNRARQGCAYIMQLLSERAIRAADASPEMHSGWSANRSRQLTRPSPSLTIPDSVQKTGIGEVRSNAGSPFHATFQSTGPEGRSELGPCPEKFHPSEERVVRFEHHQCHKHQHQPRRHQDSIHQGQPLPGHVHEDSDNQTCLQDHE